MIQAGAGFELAAPLAPEDPPVPDCPEDVAVADALDLAGEDAPIPEPMLEEVPPVEELDPEPDPEVVVEDVLPVAGNCTAP